MCVSVWNVSQAQNNGKSRWHLKVVRAFHLTMWAELESQAVITYAHTWTHIVIVPIDWRTSIWSVEQTMPINCRFLRRVFLLKRCGNLPNTMIDDLGKRSTITTNCLYHIKNYCSVYLLRHFSYAISLFTFKSFSNRFFCLEKYISLFMFV